MLVCAADLRTHVAAPGSYTDDVAAAAALYDMLAFSVGSAALTCTDDALKALPFCDASLSISDRATDLADRLTTAQRIGQMKRNGAAPVPSLGLEPFNYGGEALHGLWSTCAFDNGTKCPTQFPTPLALGASFNRDLWRAAADVASTEARALYLNNLQNATGDAPAKSLEGPLGLVYYTPNVNVLRDGRWGRAEEVPSEDPYMNGEYGAAFVRGFQEGAAGAPSHAPYIKAAVVVKHFAAYSLEWDYAAGVDRHGFDANVRRPTAPAAAPPALLVVRRSSLPAR